MKRFGFRFLLAALWVLCMIASFLYGYTRDSGIVAGGEQEALEEAFRQSMTGATLEGSFTINGEPRDDLRVERYTVQEVSKLGGGLWVLNTRLQYGERDVTLPVPVRILWAGDTPVVTLTDAEIPGLGTFTARVLFYRDSYAGMWSSGDRGGQQFGRILPPE